MIGNKIQIQFLSSL